MTINQQQLIRRRRLLNQVLFVLAAILTAWVLGLAVSDWRHLQNKRQRLETANKLLIKRQSNTLELAKTQQQWRLVSPYSELASNAVVQALLDQINNGCRQLDAVPTRQPQYFATLTVNDKAYQIGEINTASDQVYVSSDDGLRLCDKLLAAIVLAPAINFIDKRLYTGELKSIQGDFGQLTDFSNIDLSVLEIAPASAEALPKNSLSSLRFVADNTTVYQAFLHENGNNLLLFEPQKSIIYVIAANPKLNAVLGL